jgi:hypothetical protein
VKTLGEYKELNKERLTFDFNSKDDFSPDADSHAVALKFWEWLLNPLPFQSFSPDRALYLSRSSGQPD